MKIYAINGSPRRKWNTATMLENALQGAVAANPATEIEIIHLYSYEYKGCVSCFECKKLGGKSYGHCAVQDALTPVLEKLLQADAILFGSPIYFGDISGMMRSFLERLIFPCLVYDKNYSSIAPKPIKTAFIYTMNVPHAVMEQNHYPERLALMESFIGRMFGHKTKTLYVNDTYQFRDYSKYKMEVFSEKEKAYQRETQFPIDCQNAYALGQELAKNS